VTIKVIEQYWCDRCGIQFQRAQQGRVTVTMLIGWFKFTNGGGSKASSPADRTSRGWENLDRDLCRDCTDSFGEWWKAGKNG
jgi:hypothetical protein